MKIRRNIIRPTGLTVVYEPDVPSDDPGVDIILIHGVGGHPIKSWLCNPSTSTSPPLSSVDITTTTTTISTGGGPPRRSRSLRNWVSPTSNKKTDTVKIFEFSPAHRQHQYDRSDHVRPSTALAASSSPSPEVTPWRLYSLRGGGGRQRGQSPKHGPSRLSSAEDANAQHTEAESSSSSTRAPSTTPPPPVAKTTRRQLLVPSPQWLANGRPLEARRQQLTEERKSTAQYWPQDFLPNSCSNARILVWGFKTIATFEEGLFPDQFDVFARGRQLLESLDELQKAPKGPSAAKRREVVFVAHSTGGIIVKEMLRLASSFSDTHNEDLLASIAGIVFLGCPLRDTTEHGSMVDAMRSMAGYATGVSSNDEALREVLGGSEDEHLVRLGKESFDAVRNEYNFPVKMYRETRIIGPWNDWTERGLRLRRDASCLSYPELEVEDIESDHVGMAKFASASNKSYESIASFIVKVAHHQSLKTRPLTERDESVSQALGIPASESQAQEEKARKRHGTDRTAPQWLLSHAHTQSWLRRSNSSDSGGASRTLWISGSTGSARSDLLASLRRHLQTCWAPETHSSIIISIKAGQDQSPLESVLIGASNAGSEIEDANKVSKNTCSATSTGDRMTEATGRASRASRAASADETPAPAQQPQRAISSATPARALRSLLSQLCAHDARLRNLVRKYSAQAASTDSLQKETLETPPYQSKHHGHKLNAAAINLPSSTANTLTQDKADLSLPLVTAVPEPVTATRRWSDPIGQTASSLSEAHVCDWQLLEQNETKAGRTIKPQQVRLEDADVISLYLDDYLGTDSTVARRSDGVSADSDQGSQNHINAKGNHKTIRIPGIRRVFILVDTADICGKESLQELLWYLGLLAERSDFSICVATMELDIIDWAELNGDKWQRPLSDTLLPVVIPENNNAEGILQYVTEYLVPDLEERDAITAKIVDRAGGLQVWAEMAVPIVNDASEEGVSGEVILSMLDDITPPRHSTRQGKLNALYSWKLGRMNPTELSQALVLMQWVMLSPEPLRLNELLVAMRLTMLTWPKEGLPGWDMKKTLDVEPAMSLRDLRKLTSGEKGITMDSPLLFWRWIQKISQGLLRLESTGSDDKVSSEPLALQRVLPADESVQLYFLQGRGFQSLLSQSEGSPQKLPSTEEFIDGSYCNMLHACLLYLNMTDLESLGRGLKPLKPMADDIPLQEKTQWRRNAEDQRRMVLSSYPFLRYVVDNLVFHLLCPRAFRYFLPQKELLHLFTANQCRIWRRWTNLLGFSIADADPSAILSTASQGAAKSVLDPVYGAKYRLERVLRKAWKTALDQQLNSMPGSARIPPRMHLRSRSEVSEKSMVFTLVGSDDPEKAQWLVPTRPRSKSASSSSSVAPSPRSPKSSRTRALALSPRFLAGIRELL